MKKSVFAVRSVVMATMGLAISSPTWAFISAPVPEPGILSLFGIGIVGAILVARYIKKK